MQWQLDRKQSSNLKLAGHHVMIIDHQDPCMFLHRCFCWWTVNMMIIKFGWKKCQLRTRWSDNRSLHCFREKTLKLHDIWTFPWQNMSCFWKLTRLIKITPYLVEKRAFKNNQEYLITYSMQRIDRIYSAVLKYSVSPSV